MEHLENLCSVLYPSKCCGSILVDHVIEPECAKVVIAKSLGYGIILGSTMVKLPQVLKMLAAKSGAGISLLSVMLELIALAFTSSYSWANSFPISAWGDVFCLLLMTALIGFLLLQYEHGHGSAYLFGLIFTTSSYALFSGLVPLKILWQLQVLNLPLVITSKLIQAYVNFRNGHTGNLSLITYSMLLAGTVARIFTSIQETGDSIIILTYVISTAINVLLVLQILLYWDATNKFIAKNLSKKKE